MEKKLKNKTILVTGGAGFIGSHLCEELLRFGCKVICFDNLSQSSISNIEFLSSNKNFILIKGDCNEKEDLMLAFSSHKIDFIFHYAATVGVKRTQENPISVLEDIKGIRNVFDLAKVHHVQKIIFASSSEVYGEPTELPEKEDGVLNAFLPYSQVKLIGESYCKAYWSTYKLPATALRFFNVYGPRQESSEYGFVVGIFMKQAVEGKFLTVVGDGKMTRDFVYVKDNVTAAIKILLNDATNGEVINLGTGESTTILDLAHKIIALSKKKLEIKYILPRNNHEITFRQPDVTKLQKLTSFYPQFTLESGLKKTYEWYKSSS